MKKIDTAALESRLARVAGKGYDEVVSAVREHFDGAKAAELIAINTSRFARSYGLDPLRTLKGFLTLTGEGIFDLSWTVHCPHCKGPCQSADSLSEIHSGSHCALCSVDYDAGFDRNVHLSFRASEAVALIEGLDPFDALLSGYEMESGLSFELEPGDKRFFEHAVAPGNYMVADMANRAVLNLVIDGSLGPGQGEYRWKITDEAPPVVLGKAGPGKLRVYMNNASSKARDLVFARMRPPDWPDAALVSTLQEFRNFFSDERLGADEAFEIRNLSLVFTDIKGSTAMYERLGDATAFAIVKEHFRLMEDIVRERGGAVVKTIGDAVMAVFHRPADAVTAARDMIDAFDAFNLDRRSKTEIIIKIGVHSGPCIAVTLNGRIDYFGSSVNIAARIQGLSDGRDIMLSKRLYEDSSSKAVFGGPGWSSEDFLVELKGISEAQEVVKVAKG